MKRSLKRTLRLVIPVFIASLVIASCVPQKKVKYLQRQQEQDTLTYNNRKRNADYRIQPKDNLYIRVFALDDKSFVFFNKQSGTSTYNDFVSDASIYLNSYTVSNDGNIDVPIIGKVFVKNLTVEETKTLLQKLIGEYLKDITIVVKLVNFRITVLGEVMHPGEFTIYKDEFNIFQALSTAGDMTEFANRSRVALIRQTESGSKVYYLDLTSDQLLKSDYYYLQPNDIIYISPLGYKRLGLGSQFPWVIVLSSVTTALLLLNYFK